ncbi:hypothetical protein NEOLEDRAFT_1176322 [Neolentinus lepideus HHB14362 ss-1]|uniref:Uncharacterized protein n=1 Tax=Neolentinus lepideus HHB14362 ss-1 TaxID=1314782 RepID=A0A165PMX6_9AGAM|nr:hypothetical protein NEOLEDRAFT_1181896 [Neolentinus lepideus HHB14362 ss-1]KZT28181.1 hypothetical protein NEOLEDRAFT_1176322 [Neolentinus lepideus HHB14362 ss-1]
MESSHHSLSGGSDFSGTNLATSFPTSDELALLEASFPSEAVNTDLARLDESLFSRHRNFELGNDSTPEHSHGQSMGPMGRIDPSGNTSDHSNFIQRKWISSNQGTNSHYSPRPATFVILALETFVILALETFVILALETFVILALKAILTNAWLTWALWMSLRCLNTALPIVNYIKSIWKQNRILDRPNRT